MQPAKSQSKKIERSRVQKAYLFGPKDKDISLYWLLDLSTGVSHGFEGQKSYQRLAVINTMAHS